jgi:glycosyltransferase involved in cell wall biosynthesis
VHFHGHLTKTAVLDMVRRSAAAVMPSRCHENQPMAVLEAFACGVPVVATPLGGLPELVGDGARGVEVVQDRPEALAAVLGRLLTDPDAAFSVGQRARAYVESEHAPDEHLRRLEKIYSETGWCH